MREVDWDDYVCVVRPSFSFRLSASAFLQSGSGAVSVSAFGLGLGLKAVNGQLLPR